MILDASAVLAFVLAEPGDDVVSRAFDGYVEDGTPTARMSTVNWLEVTQRVPGRSLHQELASLVTLEPLSRETAELAAELHAPTRAAGLSLADRVCLALGVQHGVPVLTADRAWFDLDIGVDVKLIR